VNVPLPQPAAKSADLSNLIALRDVPSLLPRRGGKKIHLATLTRWRLSGRLPCLKLGDRYYVTPETLASLCQPGNPPPLPKRERASTASASQRWARDFLASRGLG